jgi:beta-aspartyl-peptidase (threonine type)
MPARSGFTHEGRNEMDASIMNGSDLKAGAVAAVTDIKNPFQQPVR